MAGAVRPTRPELGWAPSPEEQLAVMPGDEIFPRARYRSTRVITVWVRPEMVWPWLVQVGCGRAGFYSHDLLEDVARPGSSWAWQLTADGRGGSRLVTRIHAVYEWRKDPLMVVFGCVLMEFCDFALLSAMSRGAKQRAETAGRAPRGLGARP